jgi:ABC-type hemin transport system ATPase subunit
MDIMIQTSKIARVDHNRARNVWTVVDQVAQARALCLDEVESAISRCHNSATAQKLARTITAKYTARVPAYVHPDTPTYGERLNAWIMMNKKG